MASYVSRFSVKGICAIVSNMPNRMDKIQTLNTVPSNARTVPMPVDDELHILLSRIAAKNKTAFEQFYDSTIKLCFSQALRITRSEEMTEEVVSDVYMQVWNKAASYDETRSGVKTWLMMLCRSRALDALRKRKNQQTKESINIDSIAEPSTHETPQDILTTIQQDSFLHDAMKKIKPQQRQLLSLAYFKGLTHSEIADYTKLPLGTVKTQIRRAIIMLKELMSDEASTTYDQSIGGKSYE